MANQLFTIRDAMRETGRAKETIHYHVKQMGLGKIVGGVVFLTEKEVKRIGTAIAAKRDQYDKANETKKANADGDGQADSK